MSRASYRTSLLFSIALHAIVFLILLMKLSSSTYRMPNTGNVPIVKAEIISSVPPAKPKEAPKPMAAIEQQIVNREPKVEEPPPAPPEPIPETPPKLQETPKPVVENQQHLEKVEKQKKETEKLQQIQVQEKAAQLKAAQEQIKKKQIAEENARIAKLKQQELADAKKALAKKKREQRKLALLREQKALQQRLMQQEMATEQKQLSQAQAQMQSAQSKAAIDKFKAQIIEAIQQQWVIPADADKNLSSLFIVNIAPDGTVMKVTLSRSSGNEALDRSAEVAINKASPLPVPKDAALFDNFRELRLTVSPKKIINN